MRRVLACLTSMALLYGCQTIEYGPVDGKPPARFAYREEASGESRYILTLNGPVGSNDMAVMNAMWERRARELCGHSNFTRKLYRAERPTYTYGYYGGAAGGPVLQGFLECNGGPDSH